MSDASVLVVFREQASGHRALAAAAGLGVPLTVVALAPREERVRCGVQTGALDDAICDAALRELSSARALLGRRPLADRFVVVRTRGDGDLARWARTAGLRRALVGARRAVLGVRARDGVARALAQAGLDVNVIA
jgi:hypothetical protein